MNEYLGFVVLACRIRELLIGREDYPDNLRTTVTQ